VRVHSRYERRLSDAPIAGRTAAFRLRVRRFFCTNGACPAKTFAEQIPGLTCPNARRTPLLTHLLGDIGLALAGRAGARLAGSVECGPVAAPPAGDPGTTGARTRSVKVLGVDDFALRRGTSTRAWWWTWPPTAPSSAARSGSDTFAAWLRAHEGTEVISETAPAPTPRRNRGRPKAKQVADRWHLWHNLAQHVEKTVARHRTCLSQPSTGAPMTMRSGGSCECHQLR